MRLFFVIFVLLHAAIHLLGFVKGVGWAAVPPLRQPIGPLAGVGWLAAALLLAASGALLWVDHARWWWVAALGIAVSQALIVSAWSDARVGTVLNVIIAVPVLLALADLRPGSLHSQFRSDVARLLAETAKGAPDRVTESDMAALPPAVREYLRRSGAVGLPRVANLHATFEGQFRRGPDAGWMPATIELYEAFAPPVRLFFMKASRAGVPFVAYHRYAGTEARMQVRLAGVVPLINASGPVMTRSETVTLFNDMWLLAPAALLSPHVTWSATDAAHVRAGFENAGHRISAVITFDAEGDVVNFRSEDRTQSDGKVERPLPWLTPASGYRRYGAIRVPAIGEAQWVEAAGPWTYARMVLQQLEYNVSAGFRGR